MPGAHTTLSTVSSGVWWTRVMPPSCGSIASAISSGSDMLRSSTSRTARRGSDSSTAARRSTIRSSMSNMAHLHPRPYGLPGVPRSRCRSLAGVTITIDPMTVTIGAEIGGVDLADDLSDETIEEIRQALLDWKVIFFRDQHRLDRASHVAFGRRFGDLEIHPVTPKDQDQPRGVRDPRRRRLPRSGSSGTPTSPGAPSPRSGRSSGR